MSGGLIESQREKERECASRLGRDCVTTLAPYRGVLFNDRLSRDGNLPARVPPLSLLSVFTTSLYHPRSLRQPLQR